MGKKSKTGKSRKDHFYNLAKQQGFRARSAFKLTQLASKFRLFDECFYVIDLCAAPGGWMQVARQALPMTGHVFGVDLVPISPIKGCTSITGDITTARCDKLLQEALSKEKVPNLKVDLVLHDGAPNVGSSWDRDAYVQNELVLKSVQLASKYLRANGTFVTKVFRSGDYTKLIYVFQQLFGKVQATKPTSSRNVSAEIFVVCTHYKDPAKISKDLFDLNKVFEAVEEDNDRRSAVIAAEACKPVSEKAALTSGGLSAVFKTLKKKQRGGYDAGDDYRECTLKTFFESGKPAELLVHHHKILVDEENAEFDKAIMQHPSTTDEIREAFQDLKLLGKPDLQRVLRWRLRILNERVASKEKVQKEEEEILPAKSEEEVQRELDEELENLLQKDAKTKLKWLRKQKAKQRKAEMRTKIASAVFVPEGADPDLFSDPVGSLKILEEEDPLVPISACWDNDPSYEEAGINLGSSDEEDESESDDETDYVEKLAQELEALHAAEKKAGILSALKGSTKKLKETRREKVYKQWAEEAEAFTEEIDQKNLAALKSRQASDDSEEEEEEEEEVEDVKDEDVPVKDKVKEDKAALAAKVFFNDDLFEGLTDIKTTSVLAPSSRSPAAMKPLDGDLSDDETTTASVDADGIRELDEKDIPKIPLSDHKRRQLKRKQENERKMVREAKKARKEAELLSGLGGSVGEELVAAAEGSSTRAPIKEVPATELKAGSSQSQKLVEDIIKKPESKDEIAEIQAVGSLLVKKKSRMDLLDGLYNRWAFEDQEDLPTWFRDDDELARIPDLPLTKEYMDEYRRKLREISERPIRKVAEAKARKKARETKRMEAIKKQAMQIADSADGNERSKSQAIEKLMKKTRKTSDKKRQDKSYTVSRQSGGNSQHGPKGRGRKVNAAKKVVDRRLKADKRGQRGAMLRKSKSKRR